MATKTKDATSEVAKSVATQFGEDLATFGDADDSESSAVALLTVIAAIAMSFSGEWRKLSDSLTDLYRRLAHSVIYDIRLNVWRNDELVDWSGSLKVTKDAMTALVNAIVGDDAAKTVKINARDRLTKAVQRALPIEAVNVIAAELDIQLSDAQLKRINGTRGKTAADAIKDKQLRKVIDGVNALYRVGSHAENEAYSPFEDVPQSLSNRQSAKTKPSGETAADRSNEVAVTHRDAVANVATHAADKTVAIGAKLHAAIELLRVTVIALQTEGRKSWGPRGQLGVRDDCRDAIALVTVIDLLTSGKELSAAQSVALAEAMTDAAPAEMLDEIKATIKSGRKTK